MSRDATQTPTDATALAMEQVLQAEKSADLDLSRSRDRAEEILRDARNQVRRIAQRTDQRIAKLHLGYKERTEAEVQTLHGAAAGEAKREELIACDDACLQPAVDNLAARMTGEIRDQEG